MTKDKAIEMLRHCEVENCCYDGIHGNCKGCNKRIALDMAIKALKAQEFDEVVFDMNEFFSIIDDGKITVMRRGRGRVTVERPVMRMEATICSYGERREE